MDAVDTIPDVSRSMLELAENMARCPLQVERARQMLSDLDRAMSTSANERQQSWITLLEDRRMRGAPVRIGGAA